ncbi:TIR domain-containing protein [Longispora urticae]
MARKAFYSFHYVPDNWRAAKVRNSHVLEGNAPVSDNDWESVKKAGDSAIKSWIDGQLAGKSCVIVLVGSQTAGRKWINYEIEQGWALGKGVVGVNIHNLLDKELKQSSKGANPFGGLRVGGQALSSVLKVYDPPFVTSSFVYDHIKTNLAGWVEEAISIRAAH